MVATIADALADGAPLVWPAATGNLACEARHGDAAKSDAAFAQAAHVVELDLVNQRLAPARSSRAPRWRVSTRRPGRITLRVSCQTPTGLRDELARDVLGIAPEQIRVLVGDVGGGFGMKTTLYAEDVLAAWCTRQLERPVKWTAERMEEMLWRRRTAATSSAAPRWRWTATAASSHCACIRRRTWAPTRCRQAW